MAVQSEARFRGEQLCGAQLHLQIICTSTGPSSTRGKASSLASQYATLTLDDRARQTQHHAAVSPTLSLAIT